MRCDRCGRGPRQLGRASFWTRPPFGTYCFECYEEEFPSEPRPSPHTDAELDPLYALLAVPMTLFLTIFFVSLWAMMLLPRH